MEYLVMGALSGLLFRTMVGLSRAERRIAELEHRLDRPVC